MTPRERKLVIGLLIILLLVGGGLAYWQLYLPKLDELHANIEQYRKTNRESDEKIAQILKQRVVLDRARHLSLPPDVDMDRREYEKYLRKLFTDTGFQTPRVTSEQPDVNTSPKVGAKKEAVYTLLPFTVTAKGNLRAVSRAMENFYHTPLLHRIKGLSIARPLTQQGTTRQPGELDVTINFEAVVLAGASPRGYLLPNMDRWMVAADGLAAARGAPAGLAFGLWALGPTGLNGPTGLDGKPKLP